MQRTPVVVGAAGVVSTALGLWCSRARGTASFGWTAYSPLSSKAYVVVLGPPWWALALIVLGAMALGVAGTLLVLRRR